MNSDKFGWQQKLENSYFSIKNGFKHLGRLFSFYPEEFGMDKGVILKNIHKYIFVRIIIFFVIWNINGFTFVVICLEWSLIFVLLYNFLCGKLKQ